MEDLASTAASVWVQPGMATMRSPNAPMATEAARTLFRADAGDKRDENILLLERKLWAFTFCSMFLMVMAIPCWKNNSMRVFDLLGFSIQMRSNGNARIGRRYQLTLCCQ